MSFSVRQQHKGHHKVIKNSGLNMIFDFAYLWATLRRPL